jgi:hypothetical protein
MPDLPCHDTHVDAFLGIPGASKRFPHFCTITAVFLKIYDLHLQMLQETFLSAWHGCLLVV